MWGSAIALLIVSYVIYYVYKRFLGSEKYWEKYGVRHFDASKGASLLDILLGRKDLTERDAYLYDMLTSTGEKYCGVNEFSNKMLLIKDLDLVKKVLIKDFDHFADRRDFFDWAEENNIMKKMMVSMNGEAWRDLRHTVSPTFTTGKIRKMMECFNTVGKEYIEMLSNRAKANRGSVDINVSDSVSQYTVDVIAAAVFGMKAGTIQNEKSPFSSVAKRFTELNQYKAALSNLFPSLFRLLGIQVIDLNAVKWLENILNQGLQERLKQGTRKNDFLQLLVDARKGELKSVGDDELDDFEKDAQNHVTNGKKVFLSDDFLNAQSLLFFIAGFSTTTNLISFALWALAANQDVQEKLRKEVDGIVKENGDLDYDDVGKLTYMEMFVSEVLRLYTPIARLERFCSKDYKEPETGLFVPKGSLVTIPIIKIHRDPQYFSNPEKFDPEGHFSAENKAERLSPYIFMPFGAGPRNCIGMRFALIESKAAVAHIVHNFLIEPNKKTPIPIDVKAMGFQVIPPKDLELKLIPIKK